MKNNKLIYLHGFNSSPESHKAKLLQAAMQSKGLAQYLYIPEIPPVPAEAIEMLVSYADETLVEHNVVFAGSSLGGFYATWLAEKYKAKAVLINPAVGPHRLLEKYLGENVNYYTSEHWVLDKTHIQQFRDLEVETLSQPDHYLVLLQTGDETLDYRLAAEKYAECHLEIEEAGDHSFTGFEQRINKILKFCEISQ